MDHVSEAPAVQKKGSINKCPSCGAALGAFVSSCESCGHEFTDVAANRSITTLVSRLEDIERDADEKGLTGKNRQQVVLEKRARLIRDFPIPNSREDLQQLLYFIQPKIADSIKPDPNVEDWRVKFSEVINRAKYAYRNEASTLAEFERIEQSLESSLSSKVKIRAKRNPLFVALLAGIVGLGVVGVVASQKEKSELHACESRYVQGADAEKQRLEKVLTSVQADYAAKRYTEALNNATQLRWDYEDSCKTVDTEKARQQWDAKRDQVASMIQRSADADAAEKKAAADRESAEKQAAADRASAEKQAEIRKEAEVARIQAAREQAKAAQAATTARAAAIEKQW
ncbi:hypothetical protein [Ralstonia pickettii]|uniref:hypothetical protein n=1 Tax=Ralstonia pickettii TaxID=329 RepID=UPI00046A6AA7|nr:hypothetical protein [Ralstonia pickettii]